MMTIDQILADVRANLLNISTGLGDFGKDIAKQLDETLQRLYTTYSQYYSYAPMVKEGAKSNIPTAQLDQTIANLNADSEALQKLQGRLQEAFIREKLPEGVDVKKLEETKTKLADGLTELQKFNKQIVTDLKAHKTAAPKPETSTPTKKLGF